MLQFTQNYLLNTVKYKVYNMKPITKPLEKGSRKVSDKSARKVASTDLVCFKDIDKSEDPKKYKKLIVFSGLDSYFGTSMYYMHIL